MGDIRNKFRLAKVITVLLFGVIVILFLAYLKSCNNTAIIEHQFDIKKQKEAAIKKEIEKEATIISRKVDKFGSEHVTLDATEKIFPSSVLKSDATKGTFVDSTAKELNIKRKQIQDITVVLATVRAEKLKAVKELDSLKREIYTFADKYVKLKFTPKDTITNIPAFFDFQYDVDLATVKYFKQKVPLIGTKKRYIDIYSKDIRTTISGVKKFTVAQEQPKYGLKLQARTIYGLTSKKLYVGPGLSFDAGRFNFLGYTYYNLTDNRWQNTIGINYDVVVF